MDSISGDSSALLVSLWRGKNVSVSLTHVGNILGVVLTLCLATALASIVAQVIYNLYLHPLKSHPGPKLWAASRLTWAHHKLKGDLYEQMVRLHKQYGPAVRIAPDEISYITETAWKSICGYGKKDMPKDELFAFQTVKSEAPSILTARGSNHGRQRKTVAHAFSEKALREQEGWLQLYARKLLDRLETERSKGPVDMMRYYNYVTFDVIGELAFGESFGCLERGGFDAYVYSIHQGVKSMCLGALMTFYKLSFLENLPTAKELEALRTDNVVRASAKSDARMAREDYDRKDFFSYILRHNEKSGRLGGGGDGLTHDELRANAGVFIGAGSETTASALSGAVYYLGQHPAVYRRFVHEIRSAFASLDDITLSGLDQLPYLMAVIEETLRMYPPLPDNLPRIVPAGGATIDGRHVPAGMRVAVATHAASRSERNFHRGEDFIPERWLKENRAPPQGPSGSPFAGDRHDAWNPFSAGPRACLGRNLAYAEMKLFLAKVYFQYEVEPLSECNGWLTGQRSWLLRDKGPLPCKLTPVQSAH